MVHTVGFALDDSYITYRYAKHLELGYGLVFNVGEHYLGTTAPGFAILLALTHRLIDLLHIPALLAAVSGQEIGRVTILLDIPHLARYLTAIGVAAIGVLCYGFVTRAFLNPVARVVGGLGTLWIMTLPRLAGVTGHETLPYTALVLLGLYLWRTHLAAASFVLGCASVVRPDAAIAFVIAAALTGIGWLARGRRFHYEVLRLLPFLIPTLAWAVFAWIYYGSPIPGTLLAKRAQLVFNVFPVTSVDILSGSVFSAVPSAIQVIVLLCAVAGFLIAVLQNDSFAFVGLWGLGHLAAYSTLNVSFWSWYAAPLVVAYVLCCVYGMAGIVSLLWALRDRRGTTLALTFEVRPGVAPSAPLREPEPVKAQVAVSWYACAVVVAVPLALILLCTMGLGIRAGWKEITGPKRIHLHTYSFIEVADYLHREAPSGASLGTAEPGALAYFLGPNYYVVDLLGLTNPGVAQHLLDRDFEWSYLHYRPDYLLMSFSALPDKPWFKESYALIAEFHHPYWTAQGLTLKLFRRHADALKSAERTRLERPSV